MLTAQTSLGARPCRGLPTPPKVQHDLKPSLAFITNHVCTPAPQQSYQCEQPRPDAILPNPRLISTSFHRANLIDSPRFTHAFTVFAQFLDHDLSLTPEIEDIEDCCKEEFILHPSCLAIFVPPGDPFFGTNSPKAGQEGLQARSGQQQSSGNRVNQQVCWLESSHADTL